jgi:hypothetical protein
MDGIMRSRTGAPVSGTVAAAGTDNSLLLPRIILFDRPCSPVIVTNNCENAEIVVKVNVENTGSVSETFAAPKLGQFVIPPRGKTFYDTADGDATVPADGGPCWVDVSLGGQIAVHSVSFCTTNASDDLDDVSVDGFDG